MPIARPFGRNRSEIRSAHAPLTNDQIRAYAPSIFAEAAHDSRSARYTYIPTIEVLDGLRKEGFEPYAVAQSRSRDAARRDFTKHMVRLRHGRHEVDAKVGTEVPEIIVVNSHDGTSSWQMLGGVLRKVCMNGLITSHELSDIRIPHKGNVGGMVIEGAFRTLDNLTQSREAIETMKEIRLNSDEQVAFATAALVTRWDEGAAPVGPHELLRPRRREDFGNDLFTIWNRAQEALIRGGNEGRTANNRPTTTRAITGIDQNVKINRALFVLAEEMAKLRRH